ncbi:hypothetical protein JRQ81_005411 [Phrynocephalus forsythii]|uniref:Dynamin N-terminal domain-containing protein n=1 Tax=Phrynocephalus forsythii TaxID=171643 RepID=A0A9Q1B6N8_9SAUR|nr:hypothetical protein JRQ81_005411 [Phrynocephalus forsythii]
MNPQTALPKPSAQIAVMCFNALDRSLWLAVVRARQFNSTSPHPRDFNNKGFYTHKQCKFHPSAPHVQECIPRVLAPKATNEERVGEMEALRNLPLVPGLEKGQPSDGERITITNTMKDKMKRREFRQKNQECSTPGRQARRRRKDDQYQNAKWESSGRKILKKTYDKLFDVLSRGNMPEGICYLKERLDTLNKETSLEPIHIGFLGRTGAGKTSLLNAIIGKKLFLPVSGNQTCTSCIVQVKGSQSDQYEATIHLLSEGEWRDELKKLVAVLQRNGDDEEEDSTDECVSDATKKLQALYGVGAEKESYEALLRARLKVTIPPRRTISFRKNEAKEFSQALKPYIRVEDNPTIPIWPLIKYVELALPGSEMVPEGITFIDIPGTGDSNRNRDEMWKQNIDKCSVIWIISDIERCKGERVQQILLNEAINAYLAGNCTDIAMVVTKSDKLDLDEYKSENPQTEVNNEHDAILERNRSVKKNKGQSIREKLKRRLPPDSEVISKDKLVYTASATEFWNAKYLNQEETEIPELRNYIRKLFMREKKRLVTEYVNEISSILLLAENIGSSEQHLEQHFRESGIKGFVNRQINTLREKIERCFTEIEQPLCDGVVAARRSRANRVSQLLTRENGYKGFHKTLRAVCMNNGVYASKTFARIDFNEDLARSIYEKIGSSFGSIFRTQRATRSTLWLQLEEFKTKVQEEIDGIARACRIPNDNGKISTFIHEIDVILLKLKKDILQEKTVIYWTLSLSIQSDLRKHYEVASRISGPKSCDRMKTILREGIEQEVNNNMFEKAISKMKDCFKELKEKILGNLKKETSVVLKLLLLQQEQLAVPLPDIEEECRKIQQLRLTLQQDKNEK